jgi:DNA excision repair protein ERCC-1
MNEKDTALQQNVLHVHEVQRGNPILAHIKNVKWVFSKEIKPDYATNTTCALFLSVKYHHKHPKVSLFRVVIIVLCT